MPPDAGARADPGYAIREIHPSEHEALGAITVAAYEAAGDELDGDYREELADVSARAAIAKVLVAVDPDGTVLGGVTYIPAPGTSMSEVARDGEAEIRMLAVDRRTWGRGVGRSLTKACLDRARAEGRTGVALLTRPWNTAAHDLYASFGFRRDPERDWEYEPGQRLWAWALAFDP